MAQKTTTGMQLNQTNTEIYLTQTTAAAAQTTTAKEDLTATGVYLIMFFGIVLLVLVFLPYFALLVHLAKSIPREYKTWVWDSVSVSCSQKNHKYILAIICSYTALYLTFMYALEYSSHTNITWGTVCFVLDIVGNLNLCCVGIFPTDFHFKWSFKEQYWRSVVHGVAGFLFFAITNATNLLWALECNFWSGWPVNLATWLVYVSLGLFIIFLLVQGIFLLIRLDVNDEKFDSVSKNEQCLIDENVHNCTQCSKRYMFPRLNVLSIIAELLMIIALVFASLIQTLIACKWFKYFGATHESPTKPVLLNALH